jgi:flagellar biogenesis protein FliO
MHPLAGALLASASATTDTGAHVSIASLLARLVVSLLIVLMILWVLAQIVRRKGLPGSRRRGQNGRPRQVDVLTRQSIGKNQTLMTVAAHDRVLLLGVTSQQIVTLAEMDPAAYGLHAAIDVAEPLDVEVVDVDALPPSGPPSLSVVPAAGPGADEGHVRPSPKAIWNDKLDQLRALTVRKSS